MGPTITLVSESVKLLSSNLDALPWHSIPAKFPEKEQTTVPSVDYNFDIILLQSASGANLTIPYGSYVKYARPVRSCYCRYLHRILDAQSIQQQLDHLPASAWYALVAILHSLQSVYGPLTAVFLHIFAAQRLHCRSGEPDLVGQRRGRFKTVSNDQVSDRQRFAGRHSHTAT